MYSTKDAPWKKLACYDVILWRIKHDMRKSYQITLIH